MYAMYLRKSRADLDAEARGEGETLARHRATLVELARVRGLDIGRIYEEIVSADSIAARPEIQKLLTEVGAGAYTGVLCMAPDRLARGDTVDQGLLARAFADTGTLIVTPYKTYDPADEMDEEFFEFNLFMARREYKTIKRRMQAGRMASVKEGNYLGTRAPYGYRLADIEKRPSLAIDEDAAPNVRMMFAWYAYGLDGKQVGRETIAARLNDMGLRTYLGKRWTSSGIRSILSNPIYIGYVRWNRLSTVRIADGKRIRARQGKDLIAKGRHTPIIDRKTYDAVQAILSGHTAPRVHSGSDMQNPFSGILRCGICGRTMIRHSGKSGVFVRCPDRSCATTSIRMGTVEEAVIDGLRMWTVRYDNPESVENAQEDAAAIAMGQANRSLEIVAEQRSRIHDLLEQGIYATDVYLQRSAALARRETDLLAALASLSVSANRPESAPIPRLHPEVVHVVSLYEKLADAYDRNQLLKSVLSRIDYIKTRHCHRNERPADYLELRLFPKYAADRGITGNATRRIRFRRTLPPAGSGRSHTRGS